MIKGDNPSALLFCYIYNKQHGSALISKDKFEQIKQILNGNTQKA